MSDLAVVISGFAVGDNLRVDRTISELPSAIVAAWLTVKRYADQLDADATFQKIITTSEVVGTGHVVTAGGPGVDGVLRFDFVPTDTETLGARTWVFDIQVKLADDTIYTVEKGTLTLTPDVTDATTV